MDKNGNYNFRGDFNHTDGFLVRPAMWVALNSNIKTVDFLVDNQFINNDNIIYNESLKIGDTITMGRHAIDKTADANGVTNTTNIQWRVLDIKDNNAFILCKNAIFFRPYSYSGSYTWETSDIRKWLNDTFFNNAFSVNEKAHIILSDVPAHRNSHTCSYVDYEKQEYHDIPYINDKEYREVDTKDYIFIPSYDELKNYIFSNAETNPSIYQEMKCTAESLDAYLYDAEEAIYNGSNNDIYIDGKGCCMYYTRTSSRTTDSKICVKHNGTFTSNNDFKYS